MKLAFGGDFSLSWFNPFSGLSCKKAPPFGVAAVAPPEIGTEEALEQFLEQEAAIQVLNE